MNLIPLISYRNENNELKNRPIKYSLKKKEVRVSETIKTQSTSECPNTFHQQYVNGKLSLKSMRVLIPKYKPVVKNNSNFNLTYTELKQKSKKNYSNIFFNNINCFNQRNTLGCKCLNKCLWIDKWYNEIPQKTVFKSIKKNKLLNEKNMIQIEKDIDRTQPNCQTFQSYEYRNNLKFVLENYSIKDEQVGYVQGLNIIASVIVYHARNNFQSLKILQLIMIQKNLRQIYINDLLTAKKHVNIIINHLKYLNKQLYEFIEKNNIDIQIFIMGWLFSLMGNFIPIEYMHLVLDAYIMKGWIGIYKIILTLIIYLKDDILHQEDLTDIMSILSLRHLTNIDLDWQQLIMASNSMNLNTKKKNINQQ